MVYTYTIYATNGKLISIEAYTNGTAIDINNDGTDLSTGSLIKVTSKASGTDAGNNGLIKVIANDMSDGKGLVIETQKLSKGTGIEMINNEKLTSGKLLNLKTTSKLAHNPVAIDASSMTNGEVMKIEGDALTSGAALVLTTNDGSSMMSSMSSQNIEMIVDNVGKVLVTKAVFGKVQLYDKINLENCDGYKKNTADEFMITNKTSNVTKKHSCSIPCADSTVSATTTSQQQHQQQRQKLERHHQQQHKHLLPRLPQRELLQQQHHLQ